MTKIPSELFTDWNDGDVIFAKEYKQERSILRTAINDNWSRMIKKYTVHRPDGTVKTTQNLDTAINTIRFKETDQIVLTLDTSNSELTIGVRDGSISESKIVDGAIAESKIKDGAITT